MDLCAPFVAGAIEDAYKSFAYNKNLPQQLAMKRIEIVKSNIKEIMQKNALEKEELDSHYAKAVINLNTDILAVHQQDDPNIEHCEQSIVHFLDHKFKLRFHKIISPENLVRTFLTNELATQTIYDGLKKIQH